MADKEFKYDIFISYSHKDEEWVVNTLLPALEQASLKVCIDYRDFDAGKPSIVNMEDAVDESRHTVLVLTPNWTGSEWTDFEAVLTQTDDPVGRRQKMIPIMLEKCDPPKRVKSLTYVDFMRSDRLDNAWKQLFKALGKPNAPIPTSATSPSANGSRDTWHLAHPYPMPPNFTGRADEQKMLDNWLADNTNRLFILRALGGFGKSALAWQWINTHVNPSEWTKLVWWSFYEGDASFEHFIEETLKYLKLAVPQSKREQVDALLHEMQSQKVLFILDGFERLLRAYSNMNASHQGDFDKKLVEADRDCVNLDAEHFIKSICSMPNLKSKALMTTRLSPRALEQFGQFIQGCYEKELKAMDKEDAIAFMRAQGVQKGTNHEIEEVCKLYGFHPLSLRLLAGHIMTDLRNAGDILVAQKLKVSGDITSRQNHILEVSYNGISPRQQKLLSTIACLRSSTKLETLETIAENKDTLEDDLHDLMERGLVQFDKKNSIFDLHPIVRRFAYDRFTAPQRKDAHIVLVVYFEAIPQPQKIEKLEDLAPVIELYHHMVGAGDLDQAVKLLYERLSPNPLYYQFGAYQLCIELLRALFLDGEDKLPRLKDEGWQAWTLNELANAYSLSGQPRRAVPLFEMDIAIMEKMGNKKNTAIPLGNVASMAQIHTGALSAAERNLRRSIDLCREIADEGNEAFEHDYLGQLLIYRGEWKNGEQELNIGLELFEKQKHIQMQSVVWSGHALRFHGKGQSKI
jgi:tetratricopeptide (TPR) repeat protein